MVDCIASPARQCIHPHRSERPMLHAFAPLVNPGQPHHAALRECTPHTTLDVNRAPNAPPMRRMHWPCAECMPRGACAGSRLSPVAARLAAGGPGGDRGRARAPGRAQPCNPPSSAVNAAVFARRASQANGRAVAVGLNIVQAVNIRQYRRGEACFAFVCILHGWCQQ